MNNQEGIDMVKMSIIILLLVLVIGAVLSLFYLLSNSHYKTVKSMENATKSSSMERLYELHDLSFGSKDTHPLVTNVASVLSEFDETDLLYVLVSYKDTDDSSEVYIYTYEGVALTAVPEGATTIQSNSPTSMAYKKLLQFSDRRCSVSLNETSSKMFSVNIYID